MKRLILICLCVTGIVAQAQNTNSIVGIWVFDYDTSISAMSNEQQTRFNALSESVRNTIEQAYRGKQFHIYLDGTYQIHLTDGRQIQGQWQCNEDETLLSMIPNDNNRGNLYSIQELSSTTLVVIENTSNSQLIIPKWHFIKQ